MNIEDIVAILMGVVVIGIVISFLRHIWPLALLALVLVLAWVGLGHIH